jgi:hypothetical protein
VGQTIAVTDRSRVGEVFLLTADRSFSGQDGESYSAAPADATTFPGRLATRLFEADASLNHVYVMSNTVALKRDGGWDDEAMTTAADTISNFFRFYGEA